MAAKMIGRLLTGLLHFFLVAVMIQVGEAKLQEMPPTDTKCVCQEINSNVDIISEDHSTISVKVISPYNKNIISNVHHSKTTQKERIEGMEVEIRKLEGTVKAIHENLLELINGVADVLTVSAKTKSLLASLSVTAVIFCIIVSVAQVNCLKDII